MHEHKLIWIVNGQLAKQQRIKHRENRGVRADSERQRDHRRRGEAGILGQHSQAKLYVLPEESSSDTGFRSIGQSSLDKYSAG